MSTGGDDPWPPEWNTFDADMSEGARLFCETGITSKHAQTIGALNDALGRLATVTAERDRLRAGLAALRFGHATTCPGYWRTPTSAPWRCTCPADAMNARIDALLRETT